MQPETRLVPASLFERHTGPGWSELPAVIRQMHAGIADSLAQGRCDVERGRGWLANGVASLFGLPGAGEDLPVAVRFRCEQGGEHWRRTFAGHVFCSSLRSGTGSSSALIVERIGFVDFSQALVVEGDRLRLVLRRWSVLGMPLPLWLAPRSDSYESALDGRFRFHVEIGHPWLGLLVRYRGWLAPPAAVARES